MVTKDTAVVHFKATWKSGDDDPVVGNFCILTGEREAGDVTSGSVSTPLLGKIVSIADFATKNEITVQTKYSEHTTLEAKTAITAGDLGFYVLDGNKALPYDSDTHSVMDIDGLIVTLAAEADDEVEVLRG